MNAVALRRGVGEMDLNLTPFTQAIDQVPNPHNATVRLFVDQGSYYHVGFGVLTGLLPEPWNFCLSALWTGYELSEGASQEPWQNTGGKFIEFGIGLALSGLVRAFLGGRR